MTDSEYMWAWIVYLGAAASFLGIFWFWTRKIAWSEFKQILRLIVAVVLLVPWYTDIQNETLSPAWLVSVGDALLLGPDAAWRAGLVLVVTLVVALILSTVFYLVLWLKGRSRPEASGV